MLKISSLDFMSMVCMKNGDVVEKLSTGEREPTKYSNACRYNVVEWNSLSALLEAVLLL